MATIICILLHYQGSKTILSGHLVPQPDHLNCWRHSDVTHNIWSHTFTVFCNTCTQLDSSDCQKCFRKHRILHVQNVHKCKKTEELPNQIWINNNQPLSPPNSAQRPESTQRVFCSHSALISGYFQILDAKRKATYSRKK